jgi:hypothetical protein
MLAHAKIPEISDGAVSAETIRDTVRQIVDKGKVLHESADA